MTRPRFTKILPLIPLFLLFGDGVAFADWSAKMITRYGKKETNELSGRIEVSGTKLRLDVSSPTDMSVIHDQATKKSTALMHPAKIRLEGGFEQYQERIPVCVPDQLDACFKKLGLKKVRTEAIDGQPCDVYVRRTPERDFTVWRPQRMKEVAALKTLVEEKDGDRIETHFQDISLKKIDASRFVVPKGYVRAGGLEELLKGISD